MLIKVGRRGEQFCLRNLRRGEVGRQRVVVLFWKRAYGDATFDRVSAGLGMKVCQTVSCWSTRAGEPGAHYAAKLSVV